MRVDAEAIALLAKGAHPSQERLERELVALARQGALRGVVTKPPRYSATTIQAFADCERKFLWPTLAGLEEPPSAAQAFGTELHAHQEAYLKRGTQPPRHTHAGRLASVGQPLLPRPMSPGLAVEEPFELRDPRLPVVVTGTKDWALRPTDRAAKSTQLGDHKTIKNRGYYLREKTKAWLEGNIQANLYAFDEIVRLRAAGFSALRVVDKRWVHYFKEGGDAAESLRAVQDVSDVEERFDKDIVPLVRRMSTMVNAAPRVSDVPAADESVCDRYGGCKHRARCFGFGLAIGGNMGLLAGKFGKAAIAAKAQQGAGAAINPPPAKEWTPPVTEAALEAAGDTRAELDAVVEEAEKPKRARAKKADKPAGAEAQVAAVAAQTEKAFAPKGQSLRTPGSNSAHDFWLLVGTRPEKGFTVEPTLVEDLVGTAQANASQGMRSGHYREGYGLLEIAFAQWMEENAITGAVYVDPDTIVARDVLALLRAHASVVFTGVR